MDSQTKEVNSEMKLAAAHAIANAVPSRHLNEEYIMPSVFDRAMVRSVARAVAIAARRTGVASRKRRRTMSRTRQQL